MTDDNDKKPKRRLHRTMLGVAPVVPGAAGAGPVQGEGVEEDADMPAPSGRRSAAAAGVFGRSARESRPPGPPVARAKLKRAQPGTPASDEGQAPVIERMKPLKKPKRPGGLGLGLPAPSGAAKPKAGGGLGLPSPAAPAKPAPARPAPPKPAAPKPPGAKKVRPRTMLGIGLPGAPGAPTSGPGAPPKPPLPQSPSRPKAPQRPVIPRGAPPVSRESDDEVTQVTSTSNDDVLKAKLGRLRGEGSAESEAPTHPPPASDELDALSADLEEVSKPGLLPGSDVLDSVPGLEFDEDVSKLSDESEFLEGETAVGDTMTMAEDAGHDVGTGGPAPASGNVPVVEEEDDDDEDEATQILSQNPLAQARLEAFKREKSRTPRAPDRETQELDAEDLEEELFDEEDLANAPTMPPDASDEIIAPPALHLGGDIDALGRTLSEEPAGAAPLEDIQTSPEPEPEAPVVPPQPERPQAPQFIQSSSGTDEDTEIIAGKGALQVEQELLAGEKQGGGAGKVIGIILGGLVLIGVCGFAIFKFGPSIAPGMLGMNEPEAPMAEVPVPPHGDGTETTPDLPAPEQPQPEGTAPEGTAPTPPQPEGTAPEGTVPEPPQPEGTAPEAVVPEPPQPEATPEPPQPEATPEPPAPTPPPATDLPDDPEVLAERAQASLASGDTAGAEAAARRALELDDDNYPAMVALAQVLIRTDRASEALPLAHQAARRRSRVGRYHLVYGDARFANGDRGGARRSWGRALDLDDSLRSEVTRRRAQ